MENLKNSITALQMCEIISEVTEQRLWITMEISATSKTRHLKGLYKKHYYYLKDEQCSPTGVWASNSDTVVNV